MASLETYRVGASEEEKLQKFMIKFYREYWREFMSKLSCTSSHALAEYKQGSGAINGILWLDDDVDRMRSICFYHLKRRKTCITFFTEEITSYLREVLNQISIIDNLFINGPRLKDPLTVYRGVTPDRTGIYRNMKRGSTVKSKGFVSTSLKFNYSILIPTAYPISLSSLSDPRGIILKIQLPKGIPYLLLPGSPNTSFKYGETKSAKELMSDTSFPSDEFELLLDRDTTFRLVSVEKIRLNSSNFNHVEMIGASFSKAYFIQLYTLEYVVADSTKKEKNLITEHEIINTIQYVNCELDLAKPGTDEYY